MSFEYLPYDMKGYEIVASRLNNKQINIALTQGIKCFQTKQTSSCQIAKL